ncbi:MAG: hypothetical protein Q9212_006989 [Teloschistes hypoglaucus]
MDSSPCYLSGLPLELMEMIYYFVFDSIPSPGLLSVNKAFHDESVTFLRKRQQTFTYAITPTSLGLDDFSRWCYKIKRQHQRPCRIKHLAINIYPPSVARPFEMWEVWNNIRRFAKHLGAMRRVASLTVNFTDTRETTWVTEGIPNATLDLETLKKGFFGYYDIEQILITLYWEWPTGAQVPDPAR